MSQQNVDLMRRAYKAFDSGDIEAMIALCHPNVEFHSTFAAVGGAVYHGHDGMRSWHRELKDVWGEDIRWEAEVYFDLGEQTLAFQVAHARGRHSGADVALPGAFVVRWHDGLAVYGKGYAHREDALSDLGVSEDVLEPIAP